MYRTEEPGIVVCGHDAGERIIQYVQTLHSPPPIYFRHLPEILGDCLKAWHDPICIIEHEHEILDLNQGPDGQRAMALPAMPTERTIKAYELIPALLKLSPDTRFIITCHQRGSGVGTDRAIYREIPEVLKVLGFLNSTSAQNYLAKLCAKHWQSRPKTAEEVAERFRQREAANMRVHHEFARRSEERLAALGDD